MRELDGFEKREALGPKYWSDPRWEEVKKLRLENKQLEANSLVGVIRHDWGIE